MHALTVPVAWYMLRVQAAPTWVGLRDTVWQDLNILTAPSRKLSINYIQEGKSGQHSNAIQTASVEGAMLTNLQMED